MSTKLAVIGALLAPSLAFAQISVTSQTTVMINGDATPVLNGPLGEFQSNTGTNVGPPPQQPDGTVGQLPPSEYATTPIITPSLLQAAEDDITVPPEFVATVFALPPIANYPTSVAAAPDGTLFLASDGAGAQSAWDDLGRIVRLKDTNNDGVADEATAFVPNIDNPRGIVWDHDHLIVLAPPNVTVFWDRNGDGVADESKVIITGMGRVHREARVDHGQNNIEVGIDGWIYVALGDQGVPGATGTDGRKVIMRGGGVLRFRPDGTGLEVWEWGTRNIYGVAVSPTLEAFARDNTNDGGGWNVRFHHLTGMADHGYPSLFTNFPEEAITPLADFGGGSGTGAMWLDEPGIPEKWNDAPYTADYGQRAVFLQRVVPKGATFTLPGFEVTDASVNGVPLLATTGDEPPAGNEPFIELSNPMDVTVDGNSNIYVGKWSGGFSWAGRNQGALYRVSPRNFTPDPMPDFDTISAAQLMQVLNGPSHVRRIEAQRAILRRSAQIGQQIAPMLEALAADTSKSLNNRTAALFTYRLLRGTASTPFIARLVSDPTIEALALRALGDDLNQARSIPIDVVTGALSSSDPRVRKEALVTLARAGSYASAARMTDLLADPDPIVALTAVQTLRSLRAVDPTLAALDATTSDAVRKGSLLVLQSIHDPRVVDALTLRLRDDQTADRRQEIVNALARLSHTETEWNGTWWATRPSVVGPYFAPAPWAETDTIMTALNDVLERAGPAETLQMGRTYVKQGVSAGPAVTKFLAFANSEPSLIPQITSYFSTADEIPANALPVLRQAASSPDTDANVRAEAITALTKTADSQSWETVISSVSLVNAAPAGGGGRGGRGGGRGGRGGAIAAPTVPNLSPLQTVLVSGLTDETAEQLRAVTNARDALLDATFNAPDQIAALATALTRAEQALADTRADYFSRVQASVGRFTPQQTTALANQQAVATPPAGGGGRGGGGAAASSPQQQVQQAILNSPHIDDVYPVLVEEAAKMNGETSQLADSALLTLAGRRFGATGPSDAAASALDAGWQMPRRRAQIILAAVAARDTSRAGQIVAAMNDSDAAVAHAASYAVEQLGIDPAQLRAAASQPKVGTMSVDSVLNAIMNTQGSLVRGSQLTRELGCIACHTFSVGEAPKGPDLTKIAAILPRRDLAEAILVPNKSISQGFATNVIQLRNGNTVTGFVVNESGDSITVRDITAQEQRIQNADIVSRTQQETSLMPTGLANEITVNEFASLVDYIESLARP